jgi:hypothetical protein
MSKRKGKIVGEARWREIGFDGKVVSDDRTIDDVLGLVRDALRDGKFLFPCKLTPLRKALAITLEKMFAECAADDDLFFLLQAVHQNVASRYGFDGAREIFTDLGSAEYTKNMQRGIVVASFEASGLSRAEFARKLAEFKFTPSGEASEAGARRYLDRLLKQAMRNRRKASLGQPSKKLS